MKLKLTIHNKRKFFKAERKEQITKIIFETTTENEGLVYLSET